MVMLLAYPVRLMSGLVGVGISAMYRLKREGVRTPPLVLLFGKYVLEL